MSEEHEHKKDFSPHKEHHSHHRKESKGPGMAMMFAVVFVAALVGSYGGVYLSGMTGTQETVQPTPTPSPSPTPSPTPTPSPSPTPSATTSALIDDDPVKGDANAPVTIIEFSDFECPFCGRSFDQYLKPDGLLETNYIDKGQVKIVYRDFPLSFHPQAAPTAEAAQCAAEQGKFWEFHDKTFANQDSLSVASYKAWAKELGLDSTKFDNCVDSRKYKTEVESDFADGAAAGVSGTPTFFICKTEGSCVKIVGAQPWNAIESAIKSQLS